MFLDWRFGTRGVIPKTKNIPKAHPLSTDRSLYRLLTSPHERSEILSDFFSKFAAKTVAGRWSIAAALQPRKTQHTPGIVEVVERFQRTFEPERIRVCLLSPDRHKKENPEARSIAQDLVKLRGVEFHCLDARFRNANGLLLADFFDFT